MLKICIFFYSDTLVDFVGYRYVMLLHYPAHRGLRHDKYILTRIHFTKNAFKRVCFLARNRNFPCPARRTSALTPSPVPVPAVFPHKLKSYRQDHSGPFPNCKIPKHWMEVGIRPSPAGLSRRLSGWLALHCLQVHTVPRSAPLNI